MSFTLQIRLIVCLLALVLVSCGDEDVAGPGKHDYLPGETGDWYVSKTTTWNIEGDTLGSTVGAWMVVRRGDTLEGHGDVISFQSFDPRTGEFTADSLFMGDWDNGIHMYRSPTDVIELSKRWVRVADFGRDSSWVTLDTTMTNATIRLEGVDYVGSGRVIQRIAPNDGSVIVFAGRGKIAVLARCFAQVTFYKFTVVVNGQPTPLEFTEIENFCIARDRGTVKQRRDAYTIQLGTNTIGVNGFETLMANSGSN